MSEHVKILLAIVIGTLLLASLVGFVMSRMATSPRAVAILGNLRTRVRSWWVMVGVFALGIMLGGASTVILFAVTSFLAFREFITLNVTRRADHRALFWAFFVVIPIQYYAVAIGWYGLFSIWIPVFAFILIPLRITVAGDPTQFLERTSKIQWGLLVCVYFVSHVPALLMLDVEGGPAQAVSILFYFVLIVQMNDVFQYMWGTLFGRRRILPAISPNKTWEGLIGGVVTTTAVGSALYWATPFPWPIAGAMAAGAGLLGFAGDIIMSAIKRDLGVKDYSNTIAGHGGVMDRLDSISFSAPFFFHLTRYYFTP